MKSFWWYVCFVVLPGSLAWGGALGTASRAVIPSDVQQIISVDYRTLRNSPTAMALKQQVLPPNLKEFETALRGAGIDLDREVEQLTFVSFRTPKQGLRFVGIAQGQFAPKMVRRRLQLKRIRPVVYNNDNLYPMTSGMQMTFLDSSTLLFGDSAAIRTALDTRDGQVSSLDSNSQVADMISGVDSGTVWSVLDAAGTQNMMRTALGDAARLADYEAVKKRLLGSRYTMNFSSGVNFDLDVLTSDSMTASMLSSVVRAGMMYKKMSATGTEKMALDSMTVDSDSSSLRLHFRTDDQRFQSLLHSSLFASVAR